MYISTQDPHAHSSASTPFKVRRNKFITLWLPSTWTDVEKTKEASEYPLGRASRGCNLFSKVRLWNGETPLSLPRICWLFKL